MTLQIDAYGQSDIGLVRENNEDSWKLIPEHRFFLLADGMGGCPSGDVASDKAVEKMAEFVHEILAPPNPTPSLKDFSDIVYSAIQATNAHIYKLGENDPKLKGMGTTLCCIYFDQDHMIHAHVGDSRIYRFRDMELTLLTEDHTAYQEAISSGDMEEHEAELTYSKNLLSRAVGIFPNTNPDVEVKDVSPNDIYLMCSDGLTDLVTHECLEEIFVQNDSVKVIAEKLIALAKDHGGLDNITVVLAAIKEVG